MAERFTLSRALRVQAFASEYLRIAREYGVVLNVSDEGAFDLLVDGVPATAAEAATVETLAPMFDPEIGEILSAFEFKRRRVGPERARRERLEGRRV